MNKMELLGYLIQAIRQERYLGRDDMSPMLFRVLSEVHRNMIQHGYLTRRMFKYYDLDDPNFGVPKRYTRYQTICVPVTYWLFGWEFERWLKGDDRRERLEFVDLLEMLKKTEIVEVSYVKLRGKTHARVCLEDDETIHAIRVD